MRKDIEFALAILNAEYTKRRKILVNDHLEPNQRDGILTDLEAISSAKMKIEQKFTE